MRSASTSRARAAPPRRPGSYRLRLEHLEDRSQPGSVLTSAMSWSMLGGALAFLDWDAWAPKGVFSDAASESHALALPSLAGGAARDPTPFVVGTPAAPQGATTTGAIRHEDTVRSRDSTAQWTIPWTTEHPALAMAVGHGQATDLAGGQATVHSVPATASAAPAIRHSGLGESAASVVPGSGQGSINHANGLSAAPPLQAKPVGLISAASAGIFAEVRPIALHVGGAGAPQLQIAACYHFDGEGGRSVNFSTFIGGPAFDSGAGVDANLAGISFMVGSTTDPGTGQHNVMVVSIDPAGNCNMLVFSATNGDNLAGTAISVVDDGNSGSDVVISANDLTSTGFFEVRLDQGLTTIQAMNFVGGANMNCGEIAETPGTVVTAGCLFNPDGTSDVLVVKFDEQSLQMLQTMRVHFMDANGNPENSCTSSNELDNHGNVYVAGTVNDAPGDSVPVWFKVDASFASVDWVDMVANPAPGLAGGTSVEIQNDDPNGVAYLAGTVVNPLSPGPYGFDSALMKVDAASGALIVGHTWSYGSLGDYIIQSIDVDAAGNCYGTGYAWYVGFGEFAHVTTWDPTISTITDFFTYGGSGLNQGNSIEVNETGTTVWVSGYTESSDFAPIQNACQPIYGGNGDAFMSSFNTPV